MNKIIKFYIIFFSVSILFIPGCSLTDSQNKTKKIKYSRHYYLSPVGNDNNPGTREAPWKSLKIASETAKAGDLIILLPGIYEGELRLVNNGTKEAPIVIRAEPRLGAKLIGPEKGSNFILENLRTENPKAPQAIENRTVTRRNAIILNDLKYIRIEGLHIDPENSGAGWLTMINCSHIIVDDCLMENSNVGGTPWLMHNCDQIKVINNTFREGGFNMLQLSGITHLLFEGNAVSRSGHSPLMFYPLDNHNIVARSNVFHSPRGRSFEFWYTNNVLFENNIVSYAFNSGASGSSNAKFNAVQGIFRFNRIFRNAGGPIHIYPPREHLFSVTNRFYNNVFDDNAQYGIAVSPRNKIKDMLFINNIFSRNDKYGQHCQVRFTGGTSEELKLVNNVFAPVQSDMKGIYDYNSAFSVETLENADFINEYGKRYEDNMEIDPGYVDPYNYNHALSPNSPLRDAGHFLTTARGSGKSKLLTVKDASYFFDGFGIEDLRGDLIAIGNSTQQAIILKADYNTNTLLLDRKVKWNEGDPVHLPWTGNAPDIGVYEHGKDGRVSIQVIVEPFEAAPTDEVSIRAIVHGPAKIKKIKWWLGDGTIIEGNEIKHRYNKEYDYPILVQVTDKKGNTYYGTGYVWIAYPADLAAPLVHSSWDSNDNQSWWLWKSYGYPGPASFIDVNESGVRHGWDRYNIPDNYKLPGKGTNYRHVRAPENRGGLPSRIHPFGWDIDIYPEIFIRYRMVKGIPLSLELKPFGKPSVLIALSPMGSSNLITLANNILYDDGEWHELIFDVRKIREIYPEIKVLEGLYFMGSPQSAVKQGQWYDLDEIIIRPEVKN